MASGRWRRLRALLRRPKAVCLLALVVLGLTAALGGGAPRGLLQMAVAMAAAGSCDLALFRLRGERLAVPDGALITGAIVGMVLASNSPLWLAPAVAAVAVASKHLIRLRRRHVFNPAAVGLFLAAAFGASESWWGDLAALPPACVMVLVALAYAVLWRARRFASFFAYMATFFAICLAAGLMHSPLGADAFHNPILNSTLFAAGFMASDPPTSPSRWLEQAAFGAVAASASAVVYLALGGLLYPFMGLMAANALHAAIRARRRVLQSAQREAKA